ncbi:MAG: hypothetical protein RIQ89_856 [Bacteroidota bacterium]|jgi:UDP-N-acetylmuramoyl-L-alanyl-D-glutamate--2,6-diaminopimelate ligase
MKLLRDILYKVSLIEIKGNTDLNISEICFDSRAVVEGSLFIALKGGNADGHLYINQVLDSGVVAVVVQDFPAIIHEGITYIKVKDSAVALAIIAANYFDNPSEKIKLIGITGTNGKTTTATMLYKFFKAAGHKTGLISTVQNHVDDAVVPSTHTTPDPVQLNRLLDNMVSAGCTYCFMEVSSHAVVQKRIAGIKFAGGVFTNLTHDHLDYHKTFEAYRDAKKGFFDILPADAFALTNADDKNGTYMLQNTKATKKIYALRSLADFKVRIIENQFSGLQLNIASHDVHFRLVGSFNAYNLLAVYATAVLLGQNELDTLTILSTLTSVEGRFDYVKSETNIVGIVDYAHTPDALENVLNTINDINNGKTNVITVVGCGGNRDTSKRPLMAAIACEKSSKVIFTADNPRNEDPLEIIKQMELGVSPSKMKKVLSIVDRKEAIKTACMLANAGDIILIAGKGHEKYQEINGVKYPFNDKEILIQMLNQIKA